MTSLPSATAALDLSDLDNCSDAELTSMLGIAQAQFLLARTNDPRRLGQTYADAKLAVDVIGRKHRARLNAARVAQHQVLSASNVVPMARRGDVAAARVRTSARGLGSVFAAADDSAF